MNTPNIEPTSFTACETVQWQKEIVNYPPKEGWQLVYCCRNFAYSFEVKAQAENNYYVIRLSSEETSKYKPAIYWWQSRIIKENEQYIVENGEFVIKPNLVLLDSYDGRSHVKQVLDALEATIRPLRKNSSSRGNWDNEPVLEILTYFYVRCGSR